MNSWSAIRRAAVGWSVVLCVVCGPVFGCGESEGDPEPAIPSAPPTGESGDGAPTPEKSDAGTYGDEGTSVRPDAGVEPKTVVPSLRLDASIAKVTVPGSRNIDDGDAAQPPKCAETGDSGQCVSDAGCLEGDCNSACESDSDCDDGNACNGPESCVSGQCTDGSALQCNDGEPCNGEEVCHATKGCQAGEIPACGAALSACDHCSSSVQCGNGVTEGTEQCDRPTTEACEYGMQQCLSCSGCLWETLLGEYCGDGVINGPELCEPQADEACAYGVSCQVCSQECAWVNAAGPYCGDGVVNGPELCEPQAAESCPYGSATCQVCSVECGWVETGGAYCGDGVVNGPELCEPTLSGDRCTDGCSWVYAANESCGDGVVNGPETCDEGNAPPAECEYGRKSCTLCVDCQETAATGAFCGDQVLNGNEECDEGSNPATECRYGTGRCTLCQDCVKVEASAAYCGDAQVDPQEACDGTQDCAQDCTLLPLTTCGDGRIEGREVCDDGNTITELQCDYGTVSCTACNRDCTVSSQLAGPYCGDAITNGAEECDGQEGCSTECQIDAQRYVVCEQCLASEEQIPEFLAFNNACNADPTCAAVKACLVNDTSAQGGRSCFDDIPAECACGVGADLTACETDPNFVPAGSCINAIVAGLGSDYQRSDLLPRLTDPAYPTGQAYLIIDHATQTCPVECGFALAEGGVLE